MTTAERLFRSIADHVPDSDQRKMFGALCVRALNGKAGLMFYHDTMIFKLRGEAGQEALQLAGACVFAPGGRAMNGWVQLGEEHAEVWPKYAAIAMQEVRLIEVIKKGKK